MGGNVAISVPAITVIIRLFCVLIHTCIQLVSFLVASYDDYEVPVIVTEPVFW